MTPCSLTCCHLVEALLDDSETLPHLCHPHEIPVVTVTVSAHGHVEVHQVVSVVGGGLSNSYLEYKNSKTLITLSWLQLSYKLNSARWLSWQLTCAPEHHTAAAPVDGVLWGDDPDVDGSLLPLPVVSRHVLNLVEILAELVDVVKETNRVIL